MEIKLYGAVDVNPFDEYGRAHRCEYVDLLADGGRILQNINAWLADDLANKEERGLMSYYPAQLEWQREYGGDKYSESVDDAVRSLRMSLDVFNGCPVMVATLDAARELTADEIKKIKSYLFGQMSDGWGEGVEQDRIPLGDGKFGRLNVPLEYFTEKELKK